MIQNYENLKKMVNYIIWCITWISDPKKQVSNRSKCLDSEEDVFAAGIGVSSSQFFECYGYGGKSLKSPETDGLQVYKMMISYPKKTTDTGMLPGLA